MLDQHFIHYLSFSRHLVTIDVQVRELALVAAGRLVEHDRPVRQRVSLAGGSSGEQQGSHASSHSEADRADVGLDVLNRVVYRQSRSDAPAGAVDVEADVLLRVFRFKKQQLGDNEACQLVVDRPVQER